MTFVLVPGAGGDGHYWHLLAPLLGPDTVSVDLPAGDEDAGLAAYADAIVAAAGDASDVTLVAQSLGGFSAPLAVDRLPVSRLVLVNAMVPRAGETFDEWWGAVGQQEAARAYAVRDGRDPDAARAGSAATPCSTADTTSSRRSRPRSSWGTRPSTTRSRGAS
jgi:hypothetical protein